MFGFDGERYVGEALTPLVAQGFEIYHDVPFEGFNIDHVPVGPPGIFAVETKTRRKPGEQIVAFEVTFTNGKILALNEAPVDWRVVVMGGWWQSTIEGTPSHGASTFQDMTALRRFLTLHEDRRGFDVTGLLIVTTDFTHLKSNVLRKSDFILEETAFGH